jgi:hypothetical protein
MPVYPINFSISSSKIIEHIPTKTRLIAPLFPGELHTYVYDNEKEYYQMYQESCFAFTRKKSGWDCLRHYEIMANGCLPIFIELRECPSNIMTMLPKQLLLDIHDFYYQFIQGKKESIQDLTTEEFQQIESYIEQIVDYTRNKLTNHMMAQYILHTIRKGTEIQNIDWTPKSNNTLEIQPPHKEINKILFLSGCIKPDYLRCTLLSGLKEIYHQDCHEIPMIPHIYQEYPTPHECYGKGITYTLLFPEKEYRDASLDMTLLKDIEHHTYDIIIYGNYHRGMPYWELIHQYYTPHEIILLCGEDTHTCTYSTYCEQGYHVFVRELT